jgi:hypothetical protein
MLGSVVEFQKYGGHTVKNVGDNYVPTVEERKLRLKLIFEELSELADAYGMKKTFADMCQNHADNHFEVIIGFNDTLEFNKVESLDALCDLSVVVNGSYCTSGFTDIAQEAYDETMRSNLSKFCYSLEEAQIAIKGRDDWEYSVKTIDGKTVYAFIRKEDNKIMKGPNFFKPDYSKLLSDEKH